MSYRKGTPGAPGAGPHAPRQRAAAPGKNAAARPQAGHRPPQPTRPPAPAANARQFRPNLLQPKLQSKPAPRPTKPQTPACAARQAPAAPPVYRPQPPPKVLQKRASLASPPRVAQRPAPAAQPKRPAVAPAPPVYRPAAPSNHLQRKGSLPPAAPPRAAPAAPRPCVVQRMKESNKDKWQTKTVSTAAKVMAISSGNPIFKYKHALHHKISKETLSSIVEANAKARKKSAGARRFWKAVLDATKNVADGNDLKDDKRAWNIPANLELGPKTVSNDAGSGFDPNTVPATGRKRSMTIRSSHFNTINEIWRAASVDEGKDYAPDESDWEKMAACLEAANAAHNQMTKDTGLLSTPLYEQWVPSDKGTGFTRKRSEEYEAAKLEESRVKMVVVIDESGNYEYPEEFAREMGVQVMSLEQAKALNIDFEPYNA
jgi:hypothetical protein